MHMIINDFFFLYELKNLNQQRARRENINWKSYV